MSASTPHNIAIPPPGPLQLTATGWQDFNFKWTNYELATGLADEPDGKRVATLLSVVGDDAIRIYRTFQFADKGDATKMDKVLEKFSNYCTPCKNVVFDRYEFLSLARSNLAKVPRSTSHHYGNYRLSHVNMRK